jgi:hypothetical protein
MKNLLSKIDTTKFDLLSVNAEKAAKAAVIFGGLGASVLIYKKGRMDEIKEIVRTTNYAGGKMVFPFVFDTGKVFVSTEMINSDVVTRSEK